MTHWKPFVALSLTPKLTGNRIRLIKVGALACIKIQTRDLLFLHPVICFTTSGSPSERSFRGLISSLQIGSFDVGLFKHTHQALRWKST